MENLKKVLFVIHDLAQGGAEKVLVNLVNNMDKSKFDVSVMALFGGGVNEQFLSEDIHYWSCFSRPIRGNIHMMKLFSPGFLYRLFIHQKYDIVVSYLEGPSARIVSGCDDPGAKLVSWIHITQDTKKKASRSFRSYKEARKCYERFDRTVCVSETVKEDFQHIFELGCAVDVLYNTNETQEIIDKSKEEVTGVFREDDEIKICAVGKIEKTKGFDRLARIQRRLIEEGLRTHIFILGCGSERENIAAYLKANHIEDTYTFLGYQTNPYKYIEKCNLFVCASYAEGFSTAATEALIVGTPVITTLVSGMKEMLGENNEYGIITENDDDALYEGIKSLILDKEKLEYYKKQAEIRGKDFSTEKTVKAVEAMLLRLYEE